jgi:undecaprenyl-diphosphatase
MNPLISADYDFTLFLNGIHSPFWDHFFVLISKVVIWIPLYLAFIYVIIKKEGKAGWWIILSMILVVVLSDQISSGVLKPLVERLRPSRDPLLLGKIHLVNNYIGGMYGFVSSHAANTAGIALFLSLWLKNKWTILLLVFWTLLTSYSRVYLGVHFVGDVICGTLVGVLAAWLIYFLFRNYAERFRGAVSTYSYSLKDTYPILLVFISTFLFMALKSV